MKQILYNIVMIGIVLFALLAGVAIHSQYITQKERVAPVQQHRLQTVIYAPKKAEQILEVKRETKEEIKQEQCYDSLELLALCVEAEAGNQGLLGKRLVADVILNRVDSKDFPNDIESVIAQPYHFSSYWDGKMNEVDISEETFLAVQMELKERSYPKLLYFTAEGFSDYGTPWKKIGDHYFSTR